MRRRIICTVLIGIFMMNVLPVGTAARVGGGIPPTGTAAQDIGACETAQEMVDKITMG